jgi:hypothetical protein
LSSIADSEEKKKSENGSTESASNSKTQSINFGNIIQDFLSSANAEVEKSKFSIEKTEDGTRIDFEFTVLIRPKNKGT